MIIVPTRVGSGVDVGGVYYPYVSSATSSVKMDS